MRLLIWDLPTRLFHWCLVTAVGFAAISGFLLPERWFGWHFIAGYVIGGLLLFRLVWACLGPEHSRWQGFLPRPAAVLGHLKDMARGHPPRHLGHNPAGGAMVLALLLALGGLVATGLVVLGGEEKQGPLASLLPYRIGAEAKEIHEFFAYAILALVGLHICGVIVESLLTRENLVASMIHGRKEASAGANPPAPARRMAVGGVAVVGLLVAGTVSALATRPILGWHPLAFPAAYEKECGTCHMAYHPSLLPAASWRGLMEHLPDHFGEDASLPAPLTAELSSWLQGNAAEMWDTEAANRLRTVAADQPFRMTATPWWKHKHRHIADVVFQQKTVKSRANCAACHHDAAQGTFADQQISIPNP